MAQSLARVEAEIETAQRRHILQHDAELVAEGRQALQQALLLRWQKPDARSEWARALIDTAARVVIARQWRIEGPPDWPEQEQARIAQHASEMHGADVETRSVDEVRAGLRLRCGGMTVDMSIDGLLADGERTDSDLLALYQTIGRRESG